MANGFVFYRGISPIDNAPIVGIAVLKSRNIKTGNMVQTYIIRSDIHPVDAVDTGADQSICGNCVHRGNAAAGRKRTCYVDHGKSVSAIYKAFKRGSYYDCTHNLTHAASIIKGRKVRLGAYGDPAMIPVRRLLRSYFAGHSVPSPMRHASKAHHSPSRTIASCSSVLP